jgi:hypothetical protein
MKKTTWSMIGLASVFGRESAVCLCEKREIRADTVTKGERKGNEIRWGGTQHTHHKWVSETTNDYTQRGESIFPLYIYIYVSKKERVNGLLQNRKHLPGCWPFSHIKKERKE